MTYPPKYKVSRLNIWRIDEKCEKPVSSTRLCGMMEPTGSMDIRDFLRPQSEKKIMIREV